MRLRRSNKSAEVRLTLRDRSTHLPRWALDGGNGSVAYADDMNEEWLRMSVEISRALLDGHFNTAWSQSRKLNEELNDFLDQLQKIKGL